MSQQRGDKIRHARAQGLLHTNGHVLPPLLSVSGGGGSGFIDSTTLVSTTVSSTFTITNGGTKSVVGDTLNFNYTGTGGGSGVVATVATVSSGVITINRHYSN